MKKALLVFVIALMSLGCISFRLPSPYVDVPLGQLDETMQALMWAVEDDFFDDEIHTFVPMRYASQKPFIALAIVSNNAMHQERLALELLDSWVPSDGGVFNQRSDLFGEERQEILESLLESSVGEMLGNAHDLFVASHADESILSSGDILVRVRFIWQSSEQANPQVIWTTVVLTSDGDVKFEWWGLTEDDVERFRAQQEQ